MADRKPRSKRFRHLRVDHWVHPKFGSQVDLIDMWGGVQDYISLDVSTKRMAKELRKIAKWLEKL